MSISGCSFNFSVGGSKSPKAAAIKLIEEQLASGIGMGKLTASCDAPPKDAAVGDTFECTAETRKDGRLRFVATLSSKDRVDVVTTNLITVQGLDKIEQAAVGILEDKVGRELGRKNFDCGVGPLIFDTENDTLGCELTDPRTGDIYDAKITMSDLSDDAELSVKVADKPNR